MRKNHKCVEKLFPSASLRANILLGIKFRRAIKQYTSTLDMGWYYAMNKLMSWCNGIYRSF